MSGANQGSEEGSVETGTSDGSISTDQDTGMKIESAAVVSEKASEVAAGSSGEVTEEELLGHSEG